MKPMRSWWAVLVVTVAGGILAMLLVRARPPDGYTFTVAAGESPAALKLTFPAATMLEIDRHGRLVIRDGDRSMRIATAEARQDGARVAVRFAIDRDGDVRFVVGDYDASRPLIVTAR